MATGTLPFRGDTAALIFKAILDRVPTSPIRLNPDPPPQLEDILFLEVQKDRNLRYQHAADIRADLQRLKRDTDSGRCRPPVSSARKLRWNRKRFPSHLQPHLPLTDLASHFSSVRRPGSSASSESVGAAVALRKKHRGRFPLPSPLLTLLAVLIAGSLYFRSTPAAKLTAKDTVVLADFANTTGDPVFDGTLKQALAVDLDQSPFLRVVPPPQVQKMLAFMGRSPDERLTTDLARDLCLRVGSKAMLSGSVASLGTQYVLTLNAVNCSSGDSLAQQQAEASSKEQVLSALGSAASKLRGTLGESLASVQEFDVPIEQVTTASLAALKAFALGNAEFDHGRAMAPLPFYRRAVDSTRTSPGFMHAWARSTLTPASWDRRRSYPQSSELKDRVSERENPTSPSMTTKPLRVNSTKKLRSGAL